MNYRKIFVALTVSICMSGSAHAGLVGVKSIEIRNALNDWLQVAEFSTWNTGGTNVALSSNGATASAPDSWNSTSTPGKAIDGSTVTTFPNIFHEGSPLTHDKLLITLSTVEELLSFQIWGRSDCCSNRDLYDITFKDSNGAVLFFADDVDARNGFHTATGQLPNTAQQVPEPVSLALLGLGLLGLGVIRRTRHRTSI